MANTAKVREIRNVMIDRFGPNCWMGYKLSKKNKFTYHHILEQRNGVHETIENGAILTNKAHSDLNEMESHILKLYRTLNSLFIELNKTNKPPTIEYYKEVYDILIEARKHIDIHNNCMLKQGIDFGLLNEMIKKATELDNKVGHMELVEKYYSEKIKISTCVKIEGYLKIDGIFLPASYEEVEGKDFFTELSTIEYTQNDYMDVNGICIPTSYLITETVKESKNIKSKSKSKKKVKSDKLEIPAEHKQKLRHKNRKQR